MVVSAAVLHRNLAVVPLCCHLGRLCICNDQHFVVVVFHDEEDLGTCCLFW